MSNSKKSTIVFAGGRPARLYSLRCTLELTEQGFELVLVNPSRFLYYAGMTPGLLSRIYCLERRPVGCPISGGERRRTIREGPDQEIHSDEQKVLLESGDTIHYDAMSVCLGSGVPNKTFAISQEYLASVKPVENMENLHWELRCFENSSCPPGNRPRWGDPWHEVNSLEPGRIGGKWITK